MEEKEVICFELLGTFSLPGVGDGTGMSRTVSKKIGKKTLSFFQYLIVNCSRSISAEELIDTFWADGDSSDPANALRNMLHKIRNLLKELFPGQGELLQTLPGCYIWNPDICVETDIGKFEHICLKAKSCAGEERMELLRQAVSLYKGDFLPGNDSGWVRPLRQYYRTLYLDACRALLPLLEEKEQWMEAVGVCSQAYQIDFCVEEFTACQMRAFIAMGQPEQAIERYESFKERMLEELGIPPTEYIEQIRALVSGLNRDGGQEIFKLVCEESDTGQAFFCSFGVFQNIVALEQRHLMRTGQGSMLVIVSLDGTTTPNTDVRRLERILQEGLRTGDPVARLTAGSYILMLTGTDAAGAQTVINRLDCTFHRTYRHSNARLSFCTSALKPSL